MEQGSDKEVEERGQGRGERGKKGGLVKNYGNSFYDCYLKEKLIGSGGFGTVHLVTHKQLKVKRALKTVQKYRGARLMTEQLQLLKTLDHPNILRIYEYFETSEQWLIITEYFQGREVIEQVLQEKFLSERRTALILYEVLKALNYVHGLGIAHRDIKAENVMVRKEEEGEEGRCVVKVIDWGFAAAVPEERFDTTCGTSYYMAPEVIQGRYGLQCDMWSLGVLAFAMLHGTFPFGGTRSSQTYSLIKQSAIKFPSNSTISQPAKAFILQLLQRDVPSRLTAKQALQHPWITQFLSPQQHQQVNLHETLERLKILFAENRFQLVIISYLTNFIELPRQESRLRREFDLLDRNRDGSISEQELIEAYRRIYGPEGDLIAQRIFHTLDIDHSGDLSYSEYVTFATRIAHGFGEEQLREAFRLVDHDGDGMIDGEEVVSLLRGSLGELQSQELKDFIQQIDINNDGKIDFPEFMAHINSAARNRAPSPTPTPPSSQ